METAKSNMCKLPELEREPPLIRSVPITVKVESPNGPDGGPLVVTVSVGQSGGEQPASVGVIADALRVGGGVPEGNPETEIASPGIPKVEDDGTSVRSR